MAGFLFGIGMLTVIVGQIWLVLIVMRGSPAAALLCLIIPFLIFSFIQEHWDVAKPAVLTWASGIAVIVLAFGVHLFTR